MTIGEYFYLRKEAFDRLRAATPDLPITMATLLGEVANLLREQSRVKGNE